jgi:hypothetical protein
MPQSDRALRPVSPRHDAGIVESSDQLLAALEDVDVCARACFTDHPMVGFGSVTIAGGATRRMPVLLLEPRKTVQFYRTDSGAHSEARVEGMVGHGLERMTATGTESLVNNRFKERGWVAGCVVRRRGDGPGGVP